MVSYLELNNPEGIPRAATPNTVGISEKAKKENQIAGVGGLFTWLENEYQKCKNARHPIERKWYTNLAFYHGNQWMTTYDSAYSDARFKMDIPQVPPWRVRMVVNKVRGFVRTEMAQLNSNRPTFTVAPATDSDEDQQKSKVAEQIVEAAYYTKKFQKTCQEVTFWTSVVGNGFFKVYWDLDSSYGGKPGNICIECINPFYLFFPDYNTPSLEKQPYVIHAITRPKQYIVQKYGMTDVETITVEDLFRRAAIDTVGTPNVIPEQVLIREFWIKPNICPALPQGGYVQIIGNIITVVAQGNPYMHGQYPFCHVKHLESGGFYGVSLIEDLIPLQKEYNKNVSQLIENRNLMSRPKLLAPRGSVDVGMITDQPGQIIQYNAGFGPPTPLQIPPIPGYVIEELQIIQSDFNDVAGQTDFMRQDSAARLSSATAIAYIQEQDSSKMSLVIHSFEDALEKIGSQYLSLVLQFWDEPRMIKVAGTDKAVTSVMYKNTSIGDNTDVRVEAGSALPYNKGAKQALLMDLVKMGIIQPQDMLRVLDMRGIEKVSEAYNVSVQQAERENIKLANGQFIPANAFDEHDIHMQIHNQYRRSESYEILPDQIKQLFAQHIRTHEMATAQAQQQQAMQQQPGQAPGPEQKQPKQPGQEQQQPGQQPAQVQGNLEQMAAQIPGAGQAQEGAPQ